MENQDSDIMINLGIDFGTRFTKVCFFAEEFGAHVVNFGESGLATALIPSFVSINKKGQFSISNFLPKNQERCYIFNLRMASMGLEELDVYSNLSLVDGKCEKVAKCLTAFYLANVIDQAKILIKSAQHKNINGRNVIWSASVGIPVAYAESKLAHGFQEVLAVAWKWAEGNLSDKHTSSLESLYERSLEGLHPSKSSCQAYPSIAAAFFPFAKSKGVNGGIYVYFEVGSRSIEGALLKLRYNNEEMQIDGNGGEKLGHGSDRIAALRPKR